MFSGRRPDGRSYLLYEVHGGGEGATTKRYPSAEIAATRGVSLLTIALGRPGAPSAGGDRWRWPADLVRTRSWLLAPALTRR